MLIGEWASEQTPEDKDYKKMREALSKQEEMILSFLNRGRKKSAKDVLGAKRKASASDSETTECRKTKKVKKVKN
jgi:hypothetical protein